MDGSREERPGSRPGGTGRLGGGGGRAGHRVSICDPGHSPPPGGGVGVGWGGVCKCVGV